MPVNRARRVYRHWVTGRWTVRRLFPRSALDRIEAAIEAGERRHAGEVCFALEASLPLPAAWRGYPPRARALELFSEHRVWDTEQNCGVLVYLLLADRDVEIVADRGIHRRVGAERWMSICREMEKAFRAGKFEQGMIEGIGAISDVLAAHFPRPDDDRDELSNKPILIA